jgi:predicted helicase
MRRAVAFCAKIDHAKTISKAFNEFTKINKEELKVGGAQTLRLTKWFTLLANTLT